MYAYPDQIAKAGAFADVLVGAILLPGRAHAPPGERGDRQEHAARRRDHRRQHRSGRLHRDLPAHVPARPDLRQARRDPLLRAQLHRAGGAHRQPRAEQRGAPLRLLRSPTTPSCLLRRPRSCARRSWSTRGRWSTRSSPPPTGCESRRHRGPQMSWLDILQVQDRRRRDRAGADHLSPVDRVILNANCGEPQTLAEALTEIGPRPARRGGGAAAGARPRPTTCAEDSAGPPAAQRHVHRARACGRRSTPATRTTRRCSSRRSRRLFATGKLPLDVALVQVSPPGRARLLQLRRLGGHHQAGGRERQDGGGRGQRSRCRAPSATPSSTSAS